MKQFETVLITLVVCGVALYLLSHTQAGADLFLKVKGSVGAS